MDIYIFIVIVLLVLAVGGLVVGVSNDAVNFLNSAIGSKVASKKVIFTIASAGIIIGVLTSSGMMEVARSGVFHPEAFTFHEIMMLFLGVMFANVILLDLFNTMGLPTSTTVALVFGLLGSAIAVVWVKISSSAELTADDMSQFINSGKALVIISAILISVAIAFITGIVTMFISRLIFSFHYKKSFKKFGAIWCGLALTAIGYFAVFKGLNGSGLEDSEFIKSIFEWVSANNVIAILFVWVLCSVLMLFFQWLKINILKITILVGTFALALAFAGNDLVNFIGVPIAGLDSYHMFVESGSDATMSMEQLKGAVSVNPLYLLIAGVIMVATLWFSKKSQKVVDTEINLAKQDEGTERFGSTLLSRSIVRGSMTFSNWLEDRTPKRLRQVIQRRFTPLKEELSNKAHFDLIRATVNLTTASLLIVFATSYQLPLSTTYVTFMVAMGSSLSDKAWGRESAVYRITGVMTVVAGWFLTAFVAFVLAILITLLLLWGGVIAIIVITALCVIMFVQGSIKDKKQRAKTIKSEQDIQKIESGDQLLESAITEVCQTIELTTSIYRQTIEATLSEDRRLLRTLVRESNNLFYSARERKYELMPTLNKFVKNDIETSHYYVQVVDYLSEMTKALVHITRPCFEHIDNNHRGMSEEQVADLLTINDAVSKIYARINKMLKDNDFSELDNVLFMRDELFDMIAQAVKNQLRRIKDSSTSTKSSVLYLTILNETKTLVLQSRNLMKSQKFFMEANEPVE